MGSNPPVFHEFLSPITLYREAGNLSQAALGDAVGLSEQMIRRCEQGTIANLPNELVMALPESLLPDFNSWRKRCRRSIKQHFWTVGLPEYSSFATLARASARTFSTFGSESEWARIVKPADSINSLARQILVDPRRLQEFDAGAVGRVNVCVMVELKAVGLSEPVQRIGEHDD